MYIPEIHYNFTVNQRGNSKDFNIIQEGKWLHDTEVKYLIVPRSGRWYLQIIYVWIENPMRFLCNHIDSYDSKTKAENYAQFFQRSIRKDARGTLKTNTNAYDICFN